MTRPAGSLEFEMADVIDFEIIAENIPQVVIVLDRQLQIVWANKKAAEVAGQDPVGGTCYRLYQGRETPCQGCHTLQTFETGATIPNQSTVRYEDGSCRHFDGFTAVVGREADGTISLVAEVAGELPLL